jgi:hypothetical protein
MHLHRELSTKFCSHYALDVFHDARQQASVIVELFRAVGDLDAVFLADELVMSAFVDGPGSAPND